MLFETVNVLKILNNPEYSRIFTEIEKLDEIVGLSQRLTLAMVAELGDNQPIVSIGNFVVPVLLGSQRFRQPTRDSVTNLSIMTTILNLPMDTISDQSVQYLQNYRFLKGTTSEKVGKATKEKFYKYGELHSRTQPIILDGEIPEKSNKYEKGALGESQNTVTTPEIIKIILDIVLDDPKVKMGLITTSIG